MGGCDGFSSGVGPGARRFPPFALTLQGSPGSMPASGGGAGAPQHSGSARSAVLEPSI